METTRHGIRSKQAGPAFAIVLIAGALAHAQTSNQVAVTSVRELSRQATAHERAGDRAAAARTYERIVELDPTKRAVLSHRLVKLYAELKKPEAALKWAREIMKTHPDPQVYHAGVLSLLGRHGEAEEIIRKEIAEADAPRRKMVLYWQLADVYRQQGRVSDAKTALQNAVTSVRGQPEEKDAIRHLERFAKKTRPPNPTSLNRKEQR